MAWVRGLRASCRGGGWTLRQYLLHALRECDSTVPRTGFKKAGEECTQVCVWTSRLEGASESNPFTWPPSYVFHPPYSFRHMGERTHAYTQMHRHFLLCPSLCLLMPRPLASPLCRMWQVGDVTAVLMPDQVWPKSQHTQTHSSANATQGLYCRASTEEVRALWPPSSPNFKCHTQRNGVAWLTAGLLCKDVSSF